MVTTQEYYSQTLMVHKDPKIGIYKISEISLYCFDDKILIQNNGCDGLTLGYWS